MAKSKCIYVLLLSFGLMFSCGRDTDIEISTISGYDHESFRIETPVAEFIYQKEAGGFMTIRDDKGTDWVQFSASDSAYYPRSAESDYRGLPNLVFRSEDNGVGHPGFSKVTSRKISANQVRSESISGKWTWTWTFYPRYARLDVDHIDPETPYWFLYEGPTAGTFQPESQYWGTEENGPLYSTPDLVKGTEETGHWQTVYFGRKDYPITLFVHQVRSDTLTDMFSYMGSTMRGNQSETGMTVFGFGRGEKATPLINDPQSFIVGFYPHEINDKARHGQLLEYINGLNPDKE